MESDLVCFKEMRCPRVLSSGYHGCKTAISVDGELSDFFFVQAGIH